MFASKTMNTTRRQFLIRLGSAGGAILSAGCAAPYPAGRRAGAGSTDLSQRIYDEGRKVFNAAVDRWPCCVYRPDSEREVVRAVRDSRARSLALCIRGGGHGGGYSCVRDGAAVVDMRSLGTVKVDPRRGIAHIGGGARNEQVEAACAGTVWTPLTGSCPGVGYAGLILGGGSTFFSRRLGLACDSLVGARLVTPQGDLLEVSEGSNREIFWALRGGGAGNFGAVTQLTVRLQALGQRQWSGLVDWDSTSLGSALRAYRQALAEHPRDFSAGFGLRRTAEGAVSGLMLGTTLGDERLGRRPWDPVIGTRGIVQHNLAQRTPEKFQSLYASRVGPPVSFSWRSRFLAGDLTDECIEGLLASLTTAPHAPVRVGLEPFDGAVGDVARDATAFWHRDRKYLMQVSVLWKHPSEVAGVEDWLDRLFRSVRGSLVDHAFQSYADPVSTGEDAATQRDFYGANLDRLWRLKRSIDPQGRILGLVVPRLA